SAVREKLYPGEGPPLWNGRILWRGITEADAYLTGRTMIMAGYQHVKFVCYPIANQPNARGKYPINWIAERTLDPNYQWRREDYNRAGKLDEFLPWFTDWRFGWLDVPALIKGCPQVYEYPLVDRDPLQRWTHGRVTLLGDAAHPMYPIGSNGASQAILDARCLADLLVSSEHARSALAAYEADRLPKTAEIVRNNRKGGPEGVIDEVERRAPDGFDDIDDVLTHAEREAIVKGYAQVAGFAKEQVNRGSSKPTPIAAR